MSDSTPPPAGRRGSRASLRPRTTSFIAPVPPRFRSAPPRATSGEHIRLQDVDERILDQIWDELAAGTPCGTSGPAPDRRAAAKRRK